MQARFFNWVSFFFARTFIISSNSTNKIGSKPWTSLIVPSILDIFHLEENNLDEESEEVSIKSVDDILDDKNSLTDSPTNDSIWTKVQDDLENVFGESDLKIGDLVNAKEGDSPKWLDEVDDDIVLLDWHHLMQKFKKTSY